MCFLVAQVPASGTPRLIVTKEKLLNDYDLHLTEHRLGCLIDTDLQTGLVLSLAKAPSGSTTMVAVLHAASNLQRSFPAINCRS